MDHAGRVRLRALAVGVSVAGLCGWLFTNIGASAQPLADAYGISLVLVGVIAAALVATHALLQLPAGRLIDVIGARGALLLGCGLILASSVAALAAPVASLALMMRAIGGSGTALCYLAGSVSIASVDRSPVAQGLFGAGAPLGSAAALALVPWLERALGWRAPWLSAAVAAGLVGVAVAVLTPPGSPLPSRLRQRWTGVFTDARLYRLGAMLAASFGLSVVIANWTVTYVERRYDRSSVVAGATAALVIGGSALTRWLGGLISEPGRLRFVLASSMIAGPIGIVLMLSPGGLGVAIVGALVVGLAAGVPFATGFSRPQALRPEEPGTALALVNTIGNGVLVLGTPLLGLAFALNWGRAGFAIVAVLWFSAIFVLPRPEELADRHDPRIT